MGFSQHECWSGLPLPPRVDPVLPELFTMTCLSRVALRIALAQSFLKLPKPLHHSKAVVYDAYLPVHTHAALFIPLPRQRSLAPKYDEEEAQSQVMP